MLNQRGNLQIILGILVLLLIVGVGAYLIIQNDNKQISKSQQSNIAINPTTSPSTTSFKPLSLNDPQTEILFVEKGVLFSMKLDGSSPQEIFSMPSPITKITISQDKKHILLETEAGGTKNSWLYNYDTKKAEKLLISNDLVDILSPNIGFIRQRTSLEEIYTKEAASGGKDIVVDKLDGNTPSKIGYLSKPVGTRAICEVGDNCGEQFYPGTLLPSFDGNLLLSIPSPGGGLGEPAYVVSRDGTKVFNIDFYWYVSSGIWIDNDKLLVIDDKGSRIITISNNKVTSEKLPDLSLGIYFDQNDLSPSKRYLVSIDLNPSEIKLFDIVGKKAEKVAAFYNANETRLLGWNTNSTKILYIEEKSIKLYNIEDKKIYIIAKLSFFNPFLAGMR